jgi:hypothetical protein
MGQMQWYFSGIVTKSLFFHGYLPYRVMTWRLFQNDARERRPFTFTWVCPSTCRTHCPLLALGVIEAASKQYLSKTLPFQH